jgi:hypothetical protein
MENFNKLSRAEMKNVKGGVAMPPGSCSGKCNDGTSVSCSGSNCYAQDGGSESDGYCGSPGGGEKYCGAL